MKRLCLLIFIIFYLQGYLLGVVHNPQIEDDIQQKQDDILKKIDYIESLREFNISGRGILWSENFQGKGTVIDENKAVMESINKLSIDVDIKKQIFPKITVFGELRFYNDLSGFYGLGDSFEARTIYIESIMLDFIKIRVGDFYQKLTPLTFYADYNSMGMKDSIFNLMERKKLYDSFLLNKSWPLQGLQFSGDFSSSLYFNHLHFYGSIARYKETEYNRFISSGQFSIYKNNILKLFYTIINYYDVEETKVTNSVKPAFSDTVNSFKFECYPIELITRRSKVIDKPGIKLSGEYAQSIFVPDINTDEKISDYAFNIDLSVWLYKNMILFRYKDIGSEFYSPAAQSPSYFIKEINSDSLSYLSSQNLNFHFADRTYNNQIKFYRNWYNPELLTFPMYEATPNRKGITLSYLNKYFKLLTLKFKYDNYKEIRPMRTANKRNFTKLEIGIDFNLRTIDKFFPLLSINWQDEKEKRDDDKSTTTINESEDVHNNKVIISGNFTITKNWEILGGWAVFKQNGYRWIDFNNTISPLDENINSSYENSDINQTYILTGLKYNINKNSFIMLYYKFLSEKGKYSLNFINLFASILF